jgi:hypothetical protein
VAGFSLVTLAQMPAQPKAAKAEAVSRAQDGKPDLSGIWQVTGRGARRFSMEEPPLQPSALQKYTANRKGVTDPNEQGLDELDPTYNCAPTGPTRAMILRQFEIVQLPTQVLMLFEWDHWLRRVYMDGREHPEGYPFGWMGHSTGKWDGDTLVVDTAGVNDKTWLDGVGTPHSDALHVVERIRRVDHDTMEIEFLFEDPKAFTKPWGGKKVFKLRPELELLEHVNCEERLPVMMETKQ